MRKLRLQKEKVTFPREHTNFYQRPGDEALKMKQIQSSLSFEFTIYMDNQ
jgi:hypothetical protein